MTSRLPRVLALATSTIVLVASGFFLYRSFQFYQETEGISKWVEREPAAGTAAANSTTAPKEGAAPAAPKAPSAPALMDLDEVVTDLASGKDKKFHTITLRLELELFDEESRPVVEKSAGALKDTMIQVIQKESVQSLSTLSGKLYFKEVLVSRMNGLLNQAVVRDVHFSSLLIK